MKVNELHCPQCDKSQPSRAQLVNHMDRMHPGQPVPEPTPPKCICGAELVQLDTEPGEPLWWTHVWGKPDPAQCIDAAPVCETVHAQDRVNLNERLAESGARLGLVGLELAALRRQADKVVAQLEAMDSAAIHPEAVRRATLLQVVDKLLDAGNIGGSQMVMRMVGHGKGDWS